MRIIRYSATDVKGLKEAKFTPDQNLVIVGGKNGQGKTSLLDGIMFALGGKTLVDQRPVRDGADRAKVELDLGEYGHPEYTVKWSASSAGGYNLEVRTKENDLKASPQKFLSNLIGKLAFDPLEFTRLKPKDQMQTLKDLLALDFSAVEVAYDAAYKDRHYWNQRLGELKGRNQDVGLDVKGAPDEPVSVQALVEQIKQLTERQRDREMVEHAVTAALTRVESAEMTVKRIREELARAETALSEENVNLTALQKQLSELPEPNFEKIAQLEREMSEAENTNALVRRKQAWLEDKKAWDGASANQHKAQQALDAAVAEKERMLREAKFPVEGMSFGDDGILVNGIPFEQCSSAEQLRISVAMGAAMNPQLRVMLIRDGSLLDDDSMGFMDEMAKLYDLQLFIERVGVGDEGAIIIEDGEVKP